MRLVRPRLISEEIRLILKHIDFLYDQVARLEEFKSEALIQGDPEPWIDYSEF